MRSSLPHRRQRKRRSDIALTKNVARAIISRISQGKPYLKRGERTLTLGAGNGIPPISLNTYMSWMRRWTKPLGSRKSLREMVEEARLQRLAYGAMTTLDMKRVDGLFAIDNYAVRIERRTYGKKIRIKTITREIDPWRITLKIDLWKKLVERVAGDI